MADRILHWHIAGVLSQTGVKDTDVQGNAFRMDRDYRCLDTWLRVKTASQDNEGLGVQVDINDDGTSIFGVDQKPVLSNNATENTCNTFAGMNQIITEGSIVTLDVDRVGQKYSGRDLVVELYLNEV